MLRHRLVTLCVLAAISAAPAHGAVTNWTVQSASSSLTLSISPTSPFFEPQGAGSLVTTYGGTIVTEQTISGVPTAIQFLSASITANNSGDWDPLPDGLPGTAPANYGFITGDFLSYRGALRDIELGFTSGVLSLTGSPPGPQTFSDSITGEFLAGVLNFRPAFGSPSTSGPFPLVGMVAFLSAGTLNYGPTVTTLVIPTTIEFTIEGSGSQLYLLTGNIVATAPTESVPEANSLALLGLAASIVGFAGYRRKRLAMSLARD